MEFDPLYGLVCVYQNHNNLTISILQTRHIISIYQEKYNDDRL